MVKNAKLVCRPMGLRPVYFVRCFMCVCVIVSLLEICLLLFRKSVLVILLFKRLYFFLLCLGFFSLSVAPFCFFSFDTSLFLFHCFSFFLCLHFVVSSFHGRFLTFVCILFPLSLSLRFFFLCILLCIHRFFFLSSPTAGPTWSLSGSCLCVYFLFFRFLFSFFVVRLLWDILCILSLPFQVLSLFEVSSYSASSSPSSSGATLIVIIFALASSAFSLSVSRRCFLYFVFCLFSSSFRHRSCERSTSFPGGKHVDGLPPESSLATSDLTLINVSFSFTLSYLQLTLVYPWAIYNFRFWSKMLTFNCTQVFRLVTRIPSPCARPCESLRRKPAWRFNAGIQYLVVVQLVAKPTKTDAFRTSTPQKTEFLSNREFVWAEMFSQRTMNRIFLCVWSNSESCVIWPSYMWPTFGNFVSNQMMKFRHRPDLSTRDKTHRGIVRSTTCYLLLTLIYFKATWIFEFQQTK